MPTQDLLLTNTKPPLSSISTKERDDILEKKKSSKESIHRVSGGGLYMSTTSQKDFPAPATHLSTGAAAFEDALRASRQHRDRKPENQPPQGDKFGAWAHRQAQWNQAPSGYGGTWLHEQTKK
jgi:hypothetical protein